MNKAVYIGAGLDIIPILVLDDVKEFIYIDSQPFSEFGTMTYNDKIDTVTYVKDRTHIFYNSFSRNDFISRLKKLIEQNNIKIINENNSYLEFQTKANQKIKYYYSYSFPEHLDDALKTELKTCNTIVMAGFDPNKEIFNYLQKPTYFIGGCHTCYSKDPDDEGIDTSSFKLLADKPDIINKYYLLKEKNKYEYWVDINIMPEIKNNYKIIQIDNIQSINKYK
jgi:hypothetical protein